MSDKYCPFDDADSHCGEWCPLFDENTEQCAIFTIAKKLGEIEKDVKRK